MGFLDAFSSNDPQSEAMRQGLLRMGLALMQARGNPGEILGQAGTEGVNGMQSFQDRQFKQKLQQEALAEIARKKVLQGREDTSYDNANRLAALPSKFYEPAKPGGIDATGGIETDPNAPNNMIPGKMNIQALIQGLYASGIPGSVKEAIALDIQHRKDTTPIKGSPGDVFFEPGTYRTLASVPAKPASLANSIEEYQFYRTQGGKKDYETWDLDRRKSGAATMNQYGGMQAGTVGGKPAFGVTDKQGNLKVIPGFTPPAKDEKNLTEDQGKATSWLERMNQAEQVIAKAPASALTSLGSKTSMAGAVVGSVPIVGGSSFGQMVRSGVETPQRQAVRTAQETWVQGLLRSDTGAAYKDMEKDDIIRAFFWQPGEAESQKVLKQQLRDGVRRAMQVRAGPGTDRMEQVPKSNASGWSITPVN